MVYIHNCYEVPSYVKKACGLYCNTDKTKNDFITYQTPPYKWKITSFMNFKFGFNEWTIYATFD